MLQAKRDLTIEIQKKENEALFDTILDQVDQMLEDDKDATEFAGISGSFYED